MYLFQATAVAHPEHADALSAVMALLAEASRSDPGCIHFSVGRDAEDASVFRTLELWESVEDEAAHRQTPHELEARRVARERWYAVSGEMKIYRLELLETLTAEGPSDA